MQQSESKYTNLRPGRGPITVQAWYGREKEREKEGNRKSMCQSGGKYTNLEPGRGPITVQACEQKKKRKKGTDKKGSNRRAMC